ncbi:cell wall-binding repeat-containing protein [Gryllotalpicola koreensis]|uniref:Cell wall-binding repeat-containing protein n=1 Tax=Gryllotalpicola koreensis TaxID=993086 RepID=A0ABP8A1H0_9MICO
MAFSGVRATAAAVVAAAVAISTIGLVSAPAWAASAAVPASAQVLAAASYATTTFHDEWDYSNSDDLLLDDSGPSMNITGASWSGGLLSYTAEPGSYVSPVWGGYPGSLYQNRDGGLAANHIPAASYNRISIHAYASADVSAAIQWFNSPALNSSTEGGQPFGLEPGWHEYEIPLGANVFPGLKVNWAGTIEGIRFATSPSANTTIKLDFMRLYKAGADAAAKASWTVTGDPVAPFWSSNGATTCATPSQTCGPVQDASGNPIPAATGAVSVDASAYPAGTTLFLASAGGATAVAGSSVLVQPRPQPTVDTPAASGCGDYATSAFGHQWLASSNTFSVRNAKNVSLSGGKLTATNTSNDPQVYFSVGNGIDASVWRYLSVTETYNGSFNLLDQAGGGTMARVFWSNPGSPLSESQDILTYQDRPNLNVDLGTPAGTLTEPEAPVHYGYSGTINQLRWDPNEDRGSRTWTLSKVTLGRECETTSSAAYKVTWHDPGWVSGTTAVVEAVSRLDGSVHQLASVTETSGENSLSVASSAAPIGDYTIRVTGRSPVNEVTASGSSATPLRFTRPSARVAGADRWTTAVQTSKTQFPSGTSTVFVASGVDFPDALSAAPAAAAKKGALLLTASTSLPSVVSAELKRLKPKTVYVIGGTSAIGSRVYSAIAAATRVTPVRVSGADRYATSAAIAQKFFTGTVSNAFIATGAAFPDALSASAAGAVTGGPVLLVNPTLGGPTTAVSAQLSRLKPASVYVVGGTSAISSKIYSALAKGRTVSRLSGADRFATSAAVGAKFFPGTSTGALLASGMNFPDALVGAVLAGARTQPLFLAETGCISASVMAQLARLKVSSLTLMGGAAALSGDVSDDHRC